METNAFQNLRIDLFEFQLIMCEKQRPSSDHHFENGQVVTFPNPSIRVAMVFQSTLLPSYSTHYFFEKEEVSLCHPPHDVEASRSETRPTGSSWPYVRDPGTGSIEVGKFRDAVIRGDRDAQRSQPNPREMDKDRHGQGAYACYLHPASWKYHRDDENFGEVQSREGGCAIRRGDRRQEWQQLSLHFNRKYALNGGE
ncbi:hypothetical protein WN51_11567 [Melipona quadrifasciata]|uniref:Uncharacterized protein n=1 Tax=Melipona quadrifasciata TaxID=166423 RepID=A0A0N0BHH5_9HYME|nr:hypothetical protein WN51_11567 [Melipona quadrifasciata]